ncbi:hypothetical protein [Epilithonimonas sp.]|uniref:hypothetical protein n=1 Tax=Epilithonimonas sp. TaxID=2894511 RepID=UPI0035B004B3
MNISKKLIFFAFSTLLFGTIAKAQLRITFGDNPQKVLSLVKYVTNQTNSAQSEVYAQYKVVYENGNPVEIIFLKKNLSNLYGTLTHFFTAKERLIFSNNKLSKKLVEIPEKSLSEVKKAISNSNQFNFIENYIFSDDYESVYSVYLNNAKIVTVQSLSTYSQKFPAKVQEEIDKYLKKNENESQKVKEVESLKDNENSKTERITTVKYAAEYPGGISAVRKYIYDNLEIPQDFTFEGAIKMNVMFVIDKDGLVQNIRFDCCHPADIEPIIIRVLQSMPRWKPAELEDGTKTNFDMRLPISIVL